MMRSLLDSQLERIDQALIVMAGMAEAAIGDACEALLNGDVDKARAVYQNDEAIDRKERDVEALCLRTLMQHQPVAGDLRLVSAALKMITDMERVGDQAQDIAEIVTMLGADALKPPAHIAEMAREARGMLRRAIDAYVRRDVALALAVIDRDDVVDALFTRVKGELVLLVGREPQQGDAALDMLMIAKYLERIADHATNIAEWVQYAVSGVYKGETL